MPPVNPDYVSPPRPAGLSPLSLSGLMSILPQWSSFWKTPTPEELRQSEQNARRTLSAPIEDTLNAAGTGIRSLYDALSGLNMGPSQEPNMYTRGREAANLNKTIQAQKWYDEMRRKGAAMPPASGLGSLTPYFAEEPRSDQSRFDALIKELTAPEQAKAATPQASPVWAPAPQEGGISGWWNNMMKKPGFDRAVGALGLSLSQSKPGWKGALNAITRGLTAGQDVMEQSRLGERDYALRELVARAQAANTGVAAKRLEFDTAKAIMDQLEKAKDNSRDQKKAALTALASFAQSNPALFDTIQTKLKEAMGDPTSNNLEDLISILNQSITSAADPLSAWIGGEQPAAPAGPAIPRDKIVATIGGK